MAQSRSRAYRLWIALALLCAATITGIGRGPAEAEVTAVKGSACGFFTSVSLFGGPANTRGCGQPADAPASNASPSVTLPTTGSATPITATDADGALAEYGPAKIFSGQYPNLANDPGQGATSPPSGPLTVSTQGTTGASGSVTNSAEVTQGTQGTADPNQPRGIGPGPVIADAVRSTCMASESGVTASTTVTNGILVLSTDAEGVALTSEPVPANPAPNYTRTGRIDNVGDDFRVVYNEQTTAADGSITVNAVHLFLLGPTAVGEMVIAQSVCGVTATATGTTTTTAAGATTTTQAGATTTTAAGATTTTAAGATTTTAAGATTTTAAGATTTTAAGATTTTAAGATTTTAAGATTTTQPSATTTTAAGQATTTTTAPAGGGTASEVSGGACGYFTRVGLFGGPQMLRGCGQAADAPATNASPSVTLPSGGSATPITATDADGAVAEYGPAKIFSGQYLNVANDPEQDDVTSPPSGPLNVSTQGTPSGSVTSSAAVTQGTQGTADPNQPRGVGPGPIIADAVRSACTASESGVTAETTITNGVLVLSTDPTGVALTSEPVPANPPVNYTRTGRIDNVGDDFRVVYNEQITNPNGSITVSAVHLFLLGPTAVGEMVIAQSSCGRGASTGGGGGTGGGAGGTTATGSAAVASTGTNAVALVALGLLLLASGAHAKHLAPQIRWGSVGSYGRRPSAWPQPARRSPSRSRKRPWD